MDNELITAQSVGRTYMIDPGTFAGNYKNVLSDFLSWEQRDHAAEWVLNKDNIGKCVGIDETCIGKDVYTILHNKSAHGRKGAIIVIVKGTLATGVYKILKEIPEYLRDRVECVTMDLSESMRAIARMAFPKAMVVRDCFHVMQRAGEGVEELRMRYKRDAIKELKSAKAEFNKKLKQLARQRKAYLKRQRISGRRRPKGKKRGRKPMRLNTKFVPERLANGETLVEALTKCRTQLQKSRDKWNDNQEARAKILFEKYPKLKEAYDLVSSLRAIFRNKKLTKETAAEKLGEWYDKVTACTIREIKSVKDTIKYYEDEILNYFIDRQTNASAESLNSKLKVFRAMVKGITDVPFFMYRAMTVLG